MLVVLIRLLTTVLFFYFTVKWFLSVMTLLSRINLGGSWQDHVFETKKPRENEDIIDLCPKCGQVDGPRHRCPSKYSGDSSKGS